MCGHVGIAETIFKPEKEAFYYLLHLDYLRGVHSTGIGVIRTKTNYLEHREEVYKAVGGPWELYKAYPEVFEKGVIKHFPNILIGHNRHATQGEIDKESAHPFHFENIIGAHNGTVFRTSLKEFHDYDKYDIDSQMIFSQINHDPDIQKVWDAADGALALVWWDNRDNCLHFVRNKDRTLCYSFDEKRENIVWASESWMITAACSKAGLKMEQAKLFKENVHYTLDVSQKKLELVETPLNPFVPKPVVRDTGWRDRFQGWFNGTGYGTSMYDEYDEVIERKKGNNHGKGYVPPWRFFNIFEYESEANCYWGQTVDGQEVRIKLPPTKNSPQWSELRREIEDAGNDKLWKIETIHSPFTAVGNHRFIDVFASYMKIVSKHSPEIGFGFKRERLNRGQWEERVKCGCDNCLRIVEWKERKSVKWYAPDKMVCADCKDIPHVKEIIKLAYANPKRMH